MSTFVNYLKYDCVSPGLGLGDEYMNLVSEMESISEPLLLNTEDHYLEQETLILQIDNTPPPVRFMYLPKLAKLLHLKDSQIPIIPCFPQKDLLSK